MQTALDTVCELDAATRYVERARRGIEERDQFARRIYEKLNRPRNAKYQNHLGVYGQRTKIGLREFSYHLRGNDTVAVSVVDGGRANFLAIDIDRRFEQRLPVFADVLRKRGFDRAAFGINGSGFGRGKVVVTLQHRLPQSQAIRLVQDIVEEAVADGRFGKYEPKDVSSFPTKGDGSHVRLFGRNLRRPVAPWLKVLTEAPLDLKGTLDDLAHLEPCDVAPEGFKAQTRRPSSLSSWAKGFMEEPYVGATPDLFKAQMRLAHEAIVLYGTQTSEFLTEAFAKIADRSPELSYSSRRNLLRADVVARIAAYADARKLASGQPYYSDYIRLPESKLSKKPVGAVRVYSALVDFVLGSGVDPNCFGMTFDRIADLAGYSDRGKAHKATMQAVEAGLVVRLDPGLAKKDGRPGLCGLYALVSGNHKYHSQTLAAGLATAMYRKRCEERTRLGLELLHAPDPSMELFGAA